MYATPLMPPAMAAAVVVGPEYSAKSPMATQTPLPLQSFGQRTVRRGWRGKGYTPRTLVQPGPGVGKGRTFFTSGSAKRRKTFAYSRQVIAQAGVGAFHAGVRGGHGPLG